ncbi:hypothetical protein [Pseudomonas sp.]|uniref:hypothetical protein n=1 Tax=Pseudomonas sp. TaxID=306 RepID=UPI0030811385
MTQIVQRHFVGSDDRIVPPQLLARYRDALGTARCLQAVVVPGARHGSGLEQAWRRWRDQPITCQP